LSVGATLLLAGVAQARPDDTYRSFQDGNWNVKGTWEIRVGGAWQALGVSDTVPNEGDTATIQNTHNVNVSDAQGIMVLTVASGGELAIDNTGVLNFNGSGTPSLTINQTDGVKVTGELKVSKSMSILGSGSLQGQANTASIGIAPDNTTAVTLTLSAATAHGRMVIQQSGSGSAAVNFVNQGFVRADAAGNIELHSSLDSVTDSATADGCQTPRWIVEINGSANLIFNEPVSALAGSFSIDEGILQVNEDVTTSGKLNFLSGADINVAAGKTFTFSGGLCPGSCGSGTSMTGNNNCP
jgi:hypothetical protein